MAPEPPAPVPAFTLWHRTGTRGRWRPVGTAPTRAAALDLIGASGKTDGDWTVMPTDRDPNEKAKVRA